ncbi:helix-turn-helix domain-containing protein [Planctomycetota bacterium]
MRVMSEYYTPKKLMNSKQAADYLCVCPRKLWDLSKAGRIRTVRIDRAVRYDIDDLDSFIEKQKK